MRYDIQTTPNKYMCNVGVTSGLFGPNHRDYRAAQQMDCVLYCKRKRL